jgi:hypothetical protein
MKVDILERGRFGGACVNTGCTHENAGRKRLPGPAARRGTDYWKRGRARLNLAVRLDCAQA